MAIASIPVDLFNPGQVFACLGFLEAADILCGNAEGGFDWSDETEARFCLRADGEQNPCGAVLEFLAEAAIVTVCPEGIEGPWPDGAEPDKEFPAPRTALEKSKGKGLTLSALPVRLHQENRKAPFVFMSHWMKGDGREPFKLFAGQQVAAKLVRNMLGGDPEKKASKGFRDIFQGQGFPLDDPFSEICAVGGRFGFDARGGWDPLSIGTSLKEQGILLKIAPHVELLAAIGLQNARPTFLSTYEIRYAAWREILPIALCRAALVMPDAFLPKDCFRFLRAHLGDDEHYKKCFFAKLEE